MFSQSHLIIESEIEATNKENDISVRPVNGENVFELIALIEGLADSIWSGGVFQVYIKLGENYNEAPPVEIYFQTIPYHPNVDIISGRPALDFMDDHKKWDPKSHNIKHVLKSIQKLLSNPNLDRVLNANAVLLLRNNPHEYEKIVKKSILATRMIRKMLKDTDSINQLKDFQSNSYVRSFNSELFNRYPLFNPAEYKEDHNLTDRNSNNPQKSAKNISFDDYILVWNNIATTKSLRHEKNPYLQENLMSNPNLLAQHISISLNDLEDQVYRQLNEHRNLMYGNFKFENSSDSKNQQTSSELKKKINSKPVRAVNYNDLNNKSKILNISNEQQSDASFNVKGDKKPNTVIRVEINDVDEQEVDQLLNWTKNI
jgi:ubiquitin-protein ligase